MSIGTYLYKNEKIRKKLLEEAEAKTKRKQQTEKKNEKEKLTV